MVENIDKTSRQLKQALEDGKTIIVTTLQKFPVIVNSMGELPGQRFAVLVDEAHSSQSGESTKSLKTVLAVDSLERAETEDDEPSLDQMEERLNELANQRRMPPNVSFFAFTATPKPKTLELFGLKQPDGSFTPFSLYSMRQAIEEGFILDVLQNYTTYKTYWNLLKTIADDPRYDRQKAASLLKSFVELHDHAIDEKVKIIVEHLATQVAPQIKGQAKAMLVTRSRLHAVRYKLAVDRYLRAKGYPFKALVAFSGRVVDPHDGETYSEAGMNGFPEKQTADTFKQNDYRLLIVNNKFQTGFDQPLLHTMYVDKKLGGVNAVQTLSRLNRTYRPDKTETVVLDFANEAEAIQQAFQPYYDRTILSEGTDPNLMYDLERRLAEFYFYNPDEVDRFAAIYLGQLDLNAALPRLHAILDPVVERYREATVDEQAGFRKALTDYVRLYAFLAQVAPFSDAHLEKLYLFGQLLRRKLPGSTDTLPLEVQQQIELESLHIAKTSSGHISLARGQIKLAPMRPKEGQTPLAAQLDALSAIIQDLNERYGFTDFSDEEVFTVQRIETKADTSETLKASAEVNTPDNFRLSFDNFIKERFQELLEDNFKLYKKITDDPDFARSLLDALFERYLKRLGSNGEALGGV